MKKEAFLTIVVPIYNVEPYLEQCLDSLINQTEDGYVVVLVNDGSTDRSGIIAQNYANEYPELFIYVEQKNGGLGSARNHGMRITNTEYITFLDSDDWWLPRNIEKIKEAISLQAAAPDLIFTCPKVYNMASCYYTEWADNQAIQDIFSKFGQVLAPRVIKPLYKTEASVTRLIIRTEILKNHGFQFPEGIKWEDVYPHFAILNWCQRCILVKGAGFVYRVNSQSQITSLSDKSRLDIVPSFAKAFSYAYDNNWDKEEKAYIFDMMMDFVSWFTKETNKEIYPILIKRLHDFSKALPDDAFEAYCSVIKPEKKRIVLWKAIHSRYQYRIIASNERYEKMKKVFDKINRK